MTEPESERKPARCVRRLPALRLALLAGILLWLACPAISLWPVAWIAISPLILSVTRASRLRQAFWRGYLFGWIYLGSVWYWTGLTIVAWTHSQIGWLAWFGLTLILALFYGAWGGAAWWLAQRTAGWNRILALSAAWVVMEWMRTLGRLTMPWAQVSYTQYRCIPLLQIAEVAGAYGISFLIVMFNGAVAEWWRHRPDPAGLKRIQLAACIVSVVCMCGALRTQVRETGPTITVAAMQPNFHVNSESNTARDLSVFSLLTDQADRNGTVSLFVWPESAAPTDAVHDYRTFDVLRGISERYRAPVATGSRVVDPQSRSEFNSSVLITDDGAAPQRYDKEQLVPFGEFIPYRDSLPSILDANFGFPPNDVTAGSGHVPLTFTTLQGVPVNLGPFICYESMYPPYARAMTSAGANLLITQSNDDWFQSESALEQHLSAVVMRAIENRRCVVRSTTTGITCIIDPYGRIVGRLPVNTPGSIVRKVRLISSRSIYNRFGDWFVLVCGLYVLSIWFHKSGKTGARTIAAQTAEGQP
jgi:apolipoprotein N-acyltransferase